MPRVLPRGFRFCFSVWTNLQSTGCFPTQPCFASDFVMASIEISHFKLLLKAHTAWPEHFLRIWLLHFRLAEIPAPLTANGQGSRVLAIWAFSPHYTPCLKCPLGCHAISDPSCILPSQDTWESNRSWRARIGIGWDIWGIWSLKLKETLMLKVFTPGPSLTSIHPVLVRRPP